MYFVPMMWTSVRPGGGCSFIGVELFVSLTVSEAGVVGVASLELLVSSLPAAVPSVVSVVLATVAADEASAASTEEISHAKAESPSPQNQRPHHLNCPSPS